MVIAACHTKACSHEDHLTHTRPVADELRETPKSWAVLFQAHSADESLWVFMEGALTVWPESLALR